MAIHWYVGGPTFGGTAEEVDRQCLAYELNEARHGNKYFYAKHHVTLTKEFEAAQRQRRADDEILKQHLIALGGSIAAMRARRALNARPIVTVVPPNLPSKSSGTRKSLSL